MQINREGIRQAITQGLDRSRGVVILGPRQCGKTTIARSFVPATSENYFDLESPEDLARLQNPSLTLGRLQGLVVIDEIQTRPDLFPLLRVLMDREPSPARFLILGSIAPNLVRGVAESLAGRVEFLPMSGFSLAEIGVQHIQTLWWRGGFPLSYLAANDEDSYVWRRDFVRTFVERDIRLFGFELPPERLRRIWGMLAHYHGQIVNQSEIAASLGISHPTIRRYLELLEGTFLIRILPPWFQNLGKRLVKSPKVYIRDSGLLHYFLGVHSFKELESHPKLGASFEGFALEQCLLHYPDHEPYFWATHSGAELDLLLVKGEERLGIEFKYTDTPSITKSMTTAIHDLQLKKLLIVYPGTKQYPLSEEVEVVPLAGLQSLP